MIVYKHPYSHKKSPKCGSNKTKYYRKFRGKGLSIHYSLGSNFVRCYVFMISLIN